MVSTVVVRLPTITRPFTSRMRPRGAGTGMTRVMLLRAVATASSLTMTCRYQSRAAKATNIDRPMMASTRIR